MSKPTLIDPLKFAREQRQQSGKWLISQLDERVREDLLDASNSVAYTLTGFRDTNNRLSLRLTLQANLSLSCQRCMQPMSYPLAVESVLVLFTDPAKLEAACEQDEELDAILVEEELDVKALVEDEIIMGLPLAPKHETCGSEALAKLKASKPNPFAILATLKKNST